MALEPISQFRNNGVKEGNLIRFVGANYETRLYVHRLGEDSTFLSDQYPIRSGGILKRLELYSGHAIITAPSLPVRRVDQYEVMLDPSGL
jgi:hypothetical protein